MKKINGSSVLVFIVGLVLGIIGLIYLYKPSIMYTYFNETIDGITEAHLVRTSSGGPLTLIGIAILFGAFRSKFKATSLWILVVYLGGIVLGRVWSYLADGFPPLNSFVLWCITESILVVLGIYFLINIKKEANNINP